MGADDAGVSDENPAIEIAPVDISERRTIRVDVAGWLVEIQLEIERIAVVVRCRPVHSVGRFGDIGEHLVEITHRRYCRFRDADSTGEQGDGKQDHDQ